MPTLKCSKGHEIEVDEIDYPFVKDFIVSCDKDGKGRAYNIAALKYHGEFASLNDLTKLPTFIGPRKEV